MVTLHEFFGDTEVLEKLKGCRVKDVECIEKGTESILHFTLTNPAGKDLYIMFTDGSWHFGENKHEGFDVLPRDQQISILSERVLSNDMRVEIALILATFSAYNISNDTYLKEFEELDNEIIAEMIQTGLLDPASNNSVCSAWNTVLDTLGTEKTWHIIDEIHYFMQEYHKVTMPLDEAKDAALKQFTRLGRGY